MSGVGTNELEARGFVDELIANAGGTTVKITVADLLRLMPGEVSGPVYQTYAELAADLAWVESAVALVWGDDDEQLRGIYRKTGDTGAGTWTRYADSPISAVAMAAAYASAQAAAGSADTATTKASEASDSAAAAANAEVAALDASASLFPDNFLSGKTYFLDGKSYADVSDTSNEVVGDIVTADVGPVLELDQISTSTTTRGYLPRTTGRTFRVTVRTRLTVAHNTPDGLGRSTIGVISYRADGTQIGAWTHYTYFEDLAVADGWRDLSAEITPPIMFDGERVAYWRPFAQANSAANRWDNLGGVQQIKSLRVEDVTSELASAASAASASSDANTATTKAGEASASAAAAAASAATATTKANDAISAKAAAEAARDQTLAAFDNFDDRYLGSFASEPTTDNDGNALIAGTLFYDETAGGMKVYTGSAWAAAYISSAGVLLAADNLAGLADTAAARANLGLNSAATYDVTDNPDLSVNPGQLPTRGNVAAAIDAQTPEQTVEKIWSVDATGSAEVVIDNLDFDTYAEYIVYLYRCRPTGDAPFNGQLRSGSPYPVGWGFSSSVESGGAYRGLQGRLSLGGSGSSIYYAHCVVGLVQQSKDFNRNNLIAGPDGQENTTKLALFFNGKNYAEGTISLYGVRR